MEFRTSPMEAFQTTTNNALMVERAAPVTILPEQETPGGSLFLSDFDQGVAWVLSVVYTFEQRDANTMDVIKQALSKVLVHYYPFAGRLAKNSLGSLTVDCEKKLGAPFVEASANCDIGNLGDMRPLDSQVLRKLVYRDPSENILEVAPLLTAQVTKFRCGGFTLGIAVNHCMTDGTSLMNFMNSWAEVARGRPLSHMPYHDRTILKSRFPPQNAGSSDYFAPISDVSNLTALYENQPIVWKSFLFGSDKLATLKKVATGDGQVISSCSSFIALVAHVWRARSMALKMKPHQLSKFICAVDLRSKLSPPIPEYFGNAVVGAHSICTAGELIGEPISSTAARIKKAIERVNEDYVRLSIDISATYQKDHYLWSSLMLTSWQRFDYGSTDFGWGKPRDFGIGGLPTQLCVFFKEGSERNGIMVMLALPLSAMNTFEEVVQIENYARHTKPGMPNTFAKL